MTQIESTLRWRRDGLWRSLLGDINDIDITEARDPRRLYDDIDVIVQPILKERVRYSDIKRVVVVFDELCRLEPRVVILPIDFLFD